MIVGGIATLVIMIGYSMLLFKKEKLFFRINTMGSWMFVLHAISIEDWPFIIVNLFVSICLTYKVIKNG